MASAQIEFDEDLNIACKAALNYLNCGIEQRYQDIARLFAKVVYYVGPNGQTLRSREELSAVYEEIPHVFGSPKVKLINLLAAGTHDCLLQFDVLDNENNAFFPACVHHFSVNEAGEIIKFIPYFQTAHYKKLQH